METQFLATVENLIIMIDTNLGFNGEDALMGKMCETVNDCNNVIVGNCTYWWTEMSFQFGSDFMREANVGIHGQLQEICGNVKDCDNLDLGKLGDNAETQFLAIAAALVCCRLTFPLLQHLSFLKLAHPNPISTKQPKFQFFGQE